MPNQQIQLLNDLIPKNAKTQVLTQLDRITQPITDFIRGNPILSTAAVGIGTTGLVVGAAAISRKKRKKTTKTRRKKSVKRSRKKKTQAEIKRQRLRNLAKARRARRTGKRKRRVIRGRGLGTHEIRHSGKSTKGKFKLVQFRDKRTGKMVRFKARK